MNKDQRTALRKLAEEATPVAYSYESPLYNINPSAILSMLDYIEMLEKDATRYCWSLENCDEAVEIFVNNCDPEVINRFVDSAMGETK